MNLKYIKQLAQYSFSGEELDENKVEKISKKLDKGNLREYIKYLRLLLDKKTVKVSVSAKADKQTEKILTEIFNNKNLVINLDSELLAGIRVRDFDTIYNFNLKNTLDSMIEFVKE